MLACRTKSWNAKSAVRFEPHRVGFEYPAQRVRLHGISTTKEMGIWWHANVTELDLGRARGMMILMIYEML